MKEKETKIERILRREIVIEIEGIRRKERERDKKDTDTEGILRRERETEIEGIWRKERKRGREERHRYWGYIKKKKKTIREGKLIEARETESEVALIVDMIYN